MMRAALDFNVRQGDRPLENPDEDQLGYGELAHHIAEGLCRISSPNGYVVCIYGEWGVGKTTLLNFVRYYLKETPPRNRPIIAEFNPWWFSNDEDLLRRFFQHLQLILGEETEELRKIARLLGKLANVVSEVPTPYSLIVKLIGRILSYFGENPFEKDVYKLKSKIERLLENSGKRIVIIIDDIDRLTLCEIRQLFRVIKAVADFPNVTYLLAFDRRVVCNALEPSLGISTEDYLEKIVQYPIELPIPERYRIRNMFFSYLNSILFGDGTEDT
jgi:predicted KAP-like P-loop ATPase